MADDLISTIQADADVSVVVQEENVFTAFTTLSDVAPPAVMADLGDVDVTTLNNGAVLVYRANTSKWTSTVDLDAQNMDGGHF